MQQEISIAFIFPRSHTSLSRKISSVCTRLKGKNSGTDGEKFLTKPGFLLRFFITWWSEAIAYIVFSLEVSLCEDEKLGEEDLVSMNR